MIQLKSLHMNQYAYYNHCFDVLKRQIEQSMYNYINHDNNKNTLMYPYYIPWVNAVTLAHSCCTF